MYELRRTASPSRLLAPCCQWRFELHRETPRGTWPVVRGSVVALVEPVLPGEDTISLTCA